MLLFPLACGSSSSEHSHVLCARCPLCRHLGPAPCERPTVAQWRIRCSAGHTWQFGGRRGRWGARPYSFGFRSAVCLLALGEGSCRRRGCKRSTEPWVTLRLSGNPSLEVTMIK